MISLWLFSGCAMNEISLVDQPGSAAPDSTITVYIFDLCLVGDSVRYLETAVNAESLLVAPHLPLGWTVNSVQYAIDTAFYRHYGYGMRSSRNIIDSLEGLGELSSMTRAASFDASLPQYYESLNTGRVFNSFLALDGFHLPQGTNKEQIWIRYFRIQMGLLTA